MNLTINQNCYDGQLDKYYTVKERLNLRIFVNNFNIFILSGSNSHCAEAYNFYLALTERWVIGQTLIHRYGELLLRLKIRVLFVREEGGPSGNIALINLKKNVCLKAGTQKKAV